MDSLKYTYEKLVIEDDRLSKQLNTTELCTTAIIHYMFRYGNLIDKLWVEHIIEAVHQIEIGLRKEVLTLRLEKALVACELQISHHGITEPIF